MQLVDSNGNPIGQRKRSFQQMHASTSPECSSGVPSSSASLDGSTQDEVSSSSRVHAHGRGGDGPRLLNYVDAESWIGKEVRILTGRQAGVVARVTSTGNGWVQLETSAGDLAKRAHELTLDLEKDWTVGVANAADDDSFGGRRSRADSLSDRSQRISRSGRVLHGPSYASSATRTSRQSCYEGPSDGHAQHSDEYYEPHYAKRRLMVHPNIVAKKREYIQRYVDREREKLGKRPDLAYWKHMLNRTNYDPIHEHNAARDFTETVCEGCLVERWHGSKFCWNQKCLMSPIYWRLPGASTSEQQRNRAFHLASDSISLLGTSAPSLSRAGVVDSDERERVLAGPIEIIVAPTVLASIPEEPQAKAQAQAISPVADIELAVAANLKNHNEAAKEDTIKMEMEMEKENELSRALASPPSMPPKAPVKGGFTATAESLMMNAKLGELRHEARARADSFGFTDCETATPDRTADSPLMHDEA